MPGFIDPPGRYDPVTQWQKYLDGLLKMPQDDSSVQTAVQEAREVIAHNQRNPVFPE